MAEQEQEKPNPKCPCCNREVKWIKEFPYARILSFEYAQLPGTIKGPHEKSWPLQVTQGMLFWKKQIPNPDIPAEILARSEKEKQFSLNGFIYQRGEFHDVTECEKTDHEFGHMTPEQLDLVGKKSILYYLSGFKPKIMVYRDMTENVKRFLDENKDKLKTLEESVGKVQSTEDIFNLLEINWDYPTTTEQLNFSLGEKGIGNSVIEIDSERQEADFHLAGGYGYYANGFTLEVAKFKYEGLFKEK